LWPAGARQPAAQLGCVEGLHADPGDRPALRRSRGHAEPGGGCQLRAVRPPGEADLMTDNEAAILETWSAEPVGRSHLWQSARRNPLGAAAGVVCVLLVLLAMIGPAIAPHPADAANFPRLSSPSLAHPMGTDNLFRDIFSRILVGARISLGVGFAAVFVSTLLGIILGIASGYLGGICDLLVNRAIDVMLVYPGIV